MGFSNLIGLVALGFVPVIVILYMLRPKHKPKKIPSLYLWQSVMDEIESASRLHKLRSSILMVLQIVAVILLALLLAGLFIEDEKISGGDVIVVVDSSLSMQSTDLKPTRHAYAKELAIDFVNKLDVDTNVTLVELRDVPSIVMNDTSDKALLSAAIENLEVSNGYYEPNLVSETIKALKGGQDVQVVYFGDKSLAGARVYLTRRDTTNLAVYDVIATSYPSSNKVAVLSEVFNQGETEERATISLYVDTFFFWC